jgi:hypothetical protein
LINLFHYDVLDRLTGVSGAYSQGYGYDAATGNLDEKAGLTLEYADTEHPHAATSLEGGTAYHHTHLRHRRAQAGDGRHGHGVLDLFL